MITCMSVYCYNLCTLLLSVGLIVKLALLRFKIYCGVQKKVLSVIKNIACFIVCLLLGVLITRNVFVLKNQILNCPSFLLKYYFDSLQRAKQCQR